MRNKSNTIVGLDIGTTKISVVVGKISDSDPGDEPSIEIVGVGSSLSRGLRKGVVINIESTVESISKAVADAETMAGCDITSVYAGIGGGHIKSFDSLGIVGIRRREVSPYDIDRVVDAAKAVAIPVDREVLHVLPQQFIVDDQDGIKEPLGMSGVRLEARVHIITGSIPSAQNVVKCANRCGLSVGDMILSHLASAEAVLSPEEKELGVCVIDIGGGTCDIAVYHDGAIRHTAVLPVGGNHLTSDIAAGLRTPVSAAEKIKCEHGTALGSTIKGDEIIEVPSTGGRAPRVLSKNILAEILEPRVEEIFALIHKELARSSSLNLITSGMVLTGGTARLSGIIEAAEQVFGLPVRMGRPASQRGLSDLVNTPEYSVALGLILYGAGTQGQRAYYLKTSRNPLKKAIRRVNDWFNNGI